MLSLIKMICSTFSGCKLCLDDRTTFPPELKTLSDLVELAGIAKICLAKKRVLAMYLNAISTNQESESLFWHQGDIHTGTFRSK